MMSDYSTLAETIVRETKAFEDSLPLLYEGCRSRFFLQHQPTDKVCLFLHGFTATPEQFVPIGEAFFQAGYNVLIPLQPGHGVAGEWDKDNPPPMPENQEIYQLFVLRWLEIAQSLGKKVIVGGLSSGGTLAAWLALERPEEIYRSLLFAPYLSNSNIAVDLFVQIFDIYFEWKTKPEVEHFGYDGFLMPALRVFADMGNDVLERAKNSLCAPMLIVSSESDAAVGSKEHEELFESALKQQPKCRYHSFDKDLQIHHNMMTKAEGNEHQDLVIALAKAYVESEEIIRN